MNYWLGYVSILIIGLIIGIGGIVYLHRRHPARWKTILENLLLLLLTFFLLMMAAELFFKLFFAQSDGWNQTLASENWFEHYWTLNSMGYRDVEWSPSDLQTKRKILVLGDSFAAGQGVERLEDRFSNLLGAKLGQNYLVMNIATPALSTQDEIVRVKGFPYRPDILILQYFINDIRSAAEQRGFFTNKPDLEPWPVIKPLVDNSYVVNFLYWRAMRMLPLPWQTDDFAWTQAAYNDPGVWWTHQQELLTIQEGAASENVKLVVVVFPSMLDVTRSREVTEKVVALFQGLHVPVLDVADLIKDKPPGDLVASSMDAHPNEWVHQQVADKLYRMITTLEKQQQ